MNNYVSLTDKYLTAQGLITATVELAQSRAIPLYKLLRGTGIFEQDLLSFEYRFSLEQQLKLLLQFKRLMNCTDSGFLLGNQLINDNSSAAQNVLYSANLGKALSQVKNYHIQLCPLFFSQSYVEAQQFYLFLNCATAVEGEIYSYILEIYSAAFFSLVKRLTGQHPQCEFAFSFKRPRHIHQYEQYLGLKLRFDQPCTRWALNKKLLRDVNPHASQLRQMQAYSQLKQQPYIKYTFIEAVWRYLHKNLEASLEQTAHYFAMSPATFKRKLKQQGTCFSQIVDQQNKHKAIYLLTLRAKCNEQVAERLAFYDIANFRRAFKRWTGVTPSRIKI